MDLNNYLRINNSQITEVLGILIGEFEIGYFSVLFFEGMGLPSWRLLQSHSRSEFYYNTKQIRFSIFKYTHFVHITH